MTGDTCTCVGLVGGSGDDDDDLGFLFMFLESLTCVLPSLLKTDGDVYNFNVRFGLSNSWTV